MSIHSLVELPSHGNAHTRALTLEALHERVPAAFAPAAHEKLSPRYTFIPTDRILDGLMQAGFMPVDARQSHSRKGSPLHARHVLRLRRQVEKIQLRDAIPELVFLNSHDGNSGYQLRLGLYRLVCTNGLIVSKGAFPAYCVPHRGNIVEAVVKGALEAAERFSELARQVERMEVRRLDTGEQLRFAGRALSERFPMTPDPGMQPSQLLNSRRTEDSGDDLWSVLNRVQENVLKGGQPRRSPTGRLTRMRRLTSIREDVRLNSRLWEMATELLEA